MKKSLLALACAAAALAPLAVAHAQALTVLSTQSNSPTVLNLGEIGTAAMSGDTSGASYLGSSGTADYYFELNAPASQLTSYLGDLNFTGDVSSSISALGGTTLTAVPLGGPITTTFNLTPGTTYELAVTGASGTPFVANVSAAVSAAPEPATWALTVFGFGLIGVAMRRARRASPCALIEA
jgi:hypothetical protein